MIVYRQEVDFKIVIRGRCKADDQNGIADFYDMLCNYARENRDTGIINIKQEIGESSVIKAKEQGTLKTIPININIDEKNITLIANEVYKKMSEDFQRGLRTRSL